MRTKELIAIGIAGTMILIGAVPITAESPSNEQLAKFYENYIFEKIDKNQSKASLKTSRSKNLRLVGAKAEKQAAFLTLKRDILVDEMMKQHIGQKPYKIEYFLNKRFSEYNDCVLHAESNGENLLYACK